MGTMQYGDSKWQEWVLGEEEAIKHIKFAYVSLSSIRHGYAKADIIA